MINIIKYFLICFPLLGFSQKITLTTNDVYWIPENYVESILDNHNFKDHPRFCKPVESIAFKSNDIYIMGYKRDLPKSWVFEWKEKFSDMLKL